MRKLLIRESMEADLAHHQIYCTHCMRAPWKVSAKSTTTSAQLRHSHKHHPRLPTTQEEVAKVKDMNTGSGCTPGLTPFALAAQAGGGRNTTSRFDNKVNILPTIGIMLMIT